MPLGYAANVDKKYLNRLKCVETFHAYIFIHFNTRYNPGFSRTIINNLLNNFKVSKSVIFYIFTQKFYHFPTNSAT